MDDLPPGHRRQLRLDDRHGLLDHFQSTRGEPGCVLGQVVYDGVDVFGEIGDAIPDHRPSSRSMLGSVEMELGGEMPVRLEQLRVDPVGERDAGNPGEQHASSSVGNSPCDGVGEQGSIGRPDRGTDVDLACERLEPLQLELGIGIGVLLHQVDSQGQGPVGGVDPEERVDEASDQRHPLDVDVVCLQRRAGHGTQPSKLAALGEFLPRLHE